MDLGDPLLVIMTIALALPLAILAVLNWLFRNRGGIAKGWACVIFVGMSLITFFTILIVRIA